MKEDKFRIWIDGDSCPRPVREIVGRAARRLHLSVFLVANRTFAVPEQVKRIVVTDRSVDAYLLENAGAHDLVITRDIPLAEEVIGRNIDCMNDRGTLFDRETIGERRSERDRMEELRRATGIGPGPRTFGARETKEFADTLDRYLTRRLNSYP